VAARWLSVIILTAWIQSSLAAEWGYEGEIGPEHWASLSSANVLCAEGRAQSPVDLVATKSVIDDPLVREPAEPILDVTARARVMDLIDNGHTIQVTSDASVTLRLDGTLYSLVQFHFHAPSEHTLAGRQFPLESHFVMASERGELAVLGVLYSQGEHDPAFDPILAALPDGPGDERHLAGLDLDVRTLRPLSNRYYRYEGSLTTPPCSEGVKWIVVADGQPLSARQIDEFVAHLRRNNRPVQPRHGRDLVLVVPGASDQAQR